MMNLITGIQGAVINETNGPTLGPTDPTAPASPARPWKNTIKLHLM